MNKAQEKALLINEARRDYLLNASILKVVWFLSWPVVTQMLVNSLVGAVDMKMVGSLGSEAVAAVGLAQQIIMMLAISAMGIATGTTALVARYYGQGDNPGTVAAAAQSLLLTLVFSLAISGIGIPGSPLFLRLLGAEGPVLPMGSGYLNIILSGSVFFVGKYILWSIFQGVGDTRTPLKLDVLTNIINVAGNYTFIFGLGPIPAFGVSGAAMGTLLAHSVTSLLAFFYLKQKAFFSPPSLRELTRLNLAKARTVLQIGIPAGLQAAAQAGANTLILGMVARTTEGTHAISGYSVGLLIFSFAIFPGSAVATAAASLVGINLGNRNPDRAQESGWKCSLVGFWVILVLSVVIFLFAPALIAFFINDPRVIAVGASLVRTLAVVEPLHAVGIILSRAMHGAGEARTPFIISVLAWVGVRIPLAWFLAFSLDLQAQGIWYAIAFSQVLAAALLIAIYRGGILYRAKEITGEPETTGRDILDIPDPGSK
jgi:putative MATE family efflux protein